jgi:hypothetical protein
MSVNPLICFHEHRYITLAYSVSHPSYLFAQVYKHEPILFVRQTLQQVFPGLSCVRIIFQGILRQKNASIISQIPQHKIQEDRNFHLLAQHI